VTTSSNAPESRTVSAWRYVGVEDSGLRCDPWATMRSACPVRIGRRCLGVLGVSTNGFRCSVGYL
jgi:hypothetical protein